MQIEIRRAEENDIEVSANMFNNYRVWYHQDADLPAAQAFLTARLKNKESIIFLAFINGKPAGFTQLYPVFSSVRMRRAYLLNDLFVEEAARKNGVAAKLLDAAIEFGKENDAGFLMLQTSFDNKQAQALYAKAGWKKIEDYIYEFDIVASPQFGTRI